MDNPWEFVCGYEVKNKDKVKKEQIIKFYGCLKKTLQVQGCVFFTNMN